MQRIIQQRYDNDNATAITGNSTLVIDRNSGIGQVVNTNATRHGSKGRGHYRKHKGGKTPMDFTRYRKTLRGSLFNNYENNDPRVRFVTLTFSDNRIKTINGAKSKFDAYIKRLEQDKAIECYTLCPEYDSNHKPHLHAVIKLAKVSKVEAVKDDIINDWLVKSWPHGYGKSELVWDIKGLVKYLVPVYSVKDYKTVNEELKADKDLMQVAEARHHMEKENVKVLHRQAPKWLKAKRKRARALANREKKKENQKQLSGNERPVYLSRGQAKTARVKTSDKTILNYWRSAGVFGGSTTIVTTVNDYDDETGELIKSFERVVTVDRYYFTNEQSTLLYDLLSEEKTKQEVAA